MQSKKAPEKKVQSNRAEIKARLKNLLLFFPNLLLLLSRLLKDSRVPATEKALFAAAILYVIAPFDFLSDFVPFLGQIDDIYLVALTILRLINRTDENVVREHWSGGGDIVALAESIANLAPIILPRRVSKIITSKVELAKPIEIIDSAAKGKRQIFKEIA
ncbi:MAG: YkvA family protein [Pyrinomonadaceae bacterium]|nr:YkvA family protein [Pyrinomonadaceae bacterium]MCX7640075.1 YkvA family protein [Pyrinomonadaceae bacterium]MDW8304247.1 YkvA family protein [Acidobacteriota bacterium]